MWVYKILFITEWVLYIKYFLSQSFNRNYSWCNLLNPSLTLFTFWWQQKCFSSVLLNKLHSLSYDKLSKVASFYIQRLLT